MRPVRLTRAEQQAQTRERLLAAAERVFARHGYGGASIDLISAEAGFSKGAIYSNFDSKEAVFLALMRIYMERGVADLARIAAQEPTKIPAAMSQWLNTLQTDNDCLLLTTELQLHARRNEAFARDFYALQEKQTRAMAGIVERIFEAVSVPLPMDAFDWASAVTALAHGISLQRPQDKPGVAGAAGPVIDKLLKRLMRADGTSGSGKPRTRRG